MESLGLERFSGGDPPRPGAQRSVKQREKGFALGFAVGFLKTSGVVVVV